VAQGGRRGDQKRGGGVRVGFIGDSAAQLMGERGRERERVITGGDQDSWRRRRALGCVAAARLRRCDVARRGDNSGGSTGGGRRMG
jgi:hypothetical protein